MTPPESEPMKNPFRIDWTINLSSIFAAIIIIGSGFAWVSHVETKLNDVAALISQSQKTAGDISDLQRRVAVMDERGASNAETLGKIENRLTALTGG